MFHCVAPKLYNLGIYAMDYTFHTLPCSYDLIVCISVYPYMAQVDIRDK